MSDTIAVHMRLSTSRRSEQIPPQIIDAGKETDGAIFIFAISCGASFRVRRVQRGPDAWPRKEGRVDVLAKAERHNGSRFEKPGRSFRSASSPTSPCRNERIAEWKCWKCEGDQGQLLASLRVLNGNAFVVPVVWCKCSLGKTCMLVIKGIRRLSLL